MEQEILEAIREYYKDYEEQLVEILVYLSNKNLAMLSAKAAQELDEMGRCSDCGAKLEEATYTETHYELEDMPKEVFTEMVCPYCDRG